LEIRLIQVASALALLVVIFGFMGLWGHGSKSPAETEAATPPKAANLTPKPSNPEIVALGDSFTLGYPLDAKHSWTQRLSDDLDVPVINKGKGRQTAKDLLARFDSDVVAEKPGRVIIFSGIGDALQGVPLKDVETNIQAMVEKAQSNHIIPILALPFRYPGYEKEIQEIRTWEQGYALQNKITTLDFASVLFDSQGKYLSGLSDDGKYPNAQGYQVMGDYAAGVLK
jgi:lysophospholipase L1-like esterase